MPFFTFHSLRKAFAAAALGCGIFGCQSKLDVVSSQAPAEQTPEGVAPSSLPPPSDDVAAKASKEQSSGGDKKAPPKSKPQPPAPPVAKVLPEYDVEIEANSKSLTVRLVPSQGLSLTSQPVVVEDVTVSLCVVDLLADLAPAVEAARANGAESPVCPMALRGLRPDSPIDVADLLVSKDYFVSGWVKGNDTGKTAALSAVSGRTELGFKPTKSVFGELANSGTTSYFQVTLPSGLRVGYCEPPRFPKRSLCTEDPATLEVRAIQFPVTDPCDALWTLDWKVFGNLVLFACTNPGNYTQLWRTDGTDLGTFRLTNWPANVQSPLPAMKVADQTFNGKLFFAARVNNESGLWSTDGTFTGTSRFIDTNATDYGGDDFVSDVAVLNGFLYFSAYSAPNGVELWRSDGTVAGSAEFVDIWPGVAWGAPGRFSRFGSRLYFTSFYGDAKVFVTDGTVPGTQVIFTIGGGALDTRWFGSDGTRLYFTNQNSTVGTELYAIDTLTNTGTLIELVPGTGGIYFWKMAFAGGKGYFAPQGGELYQTDGTVLGTQVVKKINPTASSQVIVLGATNTGFVLFSGDDGEHGFELWRTDGTAAGTVLVSDFNAGLQSSYPSFESNDGSTAILYLTHPLMGYERFSLRFDTWEFQLLRDDGLTVSPAIKSFVEGDRLFFAQSITGTKYRSARVDQGLPSDLQTLDWVPPVSVSGGGTVPFAGRNLFVDSSTETKLYKTDGTLAGTTAIGTIAPGSARPIYTSAGALGFFVAARQSLQPYSLSRYDVDAGSVVSLGSFTGATSIQGVRVLGQTSSHAFFVVSTSGPTVQRKLWATDGTSAPALVTDPCGSASAAVFLPSGVTRVSASLGNKIYFAGTNCVAGNELWVSDGTAAGTTMVADLRTGSGSDPQDFLAVGNQVAFSADDGVNGRELWTSDGTAGGTVLHDLKLSGESTPKMVDVIGSSLFLSAETSSTGRDLWRYDSATGEIAKICDFGLLAPGATLQSLLTFEDSLLVSTVVGSASKVWQVGAKGNVCKLISTYDVPVEFVNKTPNAVWIAKGGVGSGSLIVLPMK